MAASLLYIGPYPSRWQTRGVGVNVSGNMIGYITIAGAQETGYLRQPSGKIIFFDNGGNVTPSVQVLGPVEPLCRSV
jgi:hypothetical protein